MHTDAKMNLKVAILELNDNVVVTCRYVEVDCACGRMWRIIVANIA